MKLNTILVVDDNSVDLEIVSMVCSNLDCAVEAVQDAAEALEKYKSSNYSLVLTDYMMEPMNGIELVHAIRKINPKAACMIMTGYPDAKLIDNMNEMQMSNIITKPIRPTNLTEQLRVAMNKHRGATQQLGEIALSNRMDQCVALLGHSYEICQVRKKVVELSNVQRPVFLEGPFGIGKADVIKFMHQSGPYAESHIVFCPCQDMTREEVEENILSIDGEWGTYVKEAENGTLVLNHVESIPMDIQPVLAKKMKAIAKHCRIVSWAHESIDDLLNSGQIDTELYFELTLDTIHLPALSERPVDIEEIVRFIASSPEAFGLDRQMKPTEVDVLVAELRKCELKGNLRELTERIKAASHFVDAS
jgi:DNA-binding NtrC family response regulator